MRRSSESVFYEAPRTCAPRVEISAAFLRGPLHHDAASTYSGRLMTTGNRMRRTVVICFMLFSPVLVAGCLRDSAVLATSRYASFSNAQLVTQFYRTPASDQELALLHILFVPVVEPSPQSGFGLSGGGGGTVSDLEFVYAYDEFDWSSRKASIRSRPVRVRNLAILEADRQSFDLSKGSVFVANVALDGGLQVVQLPVIAREHDATPAAVLEAIKHHMPANQRLQNLPTTR